MTGGSPLRDARVLVTGASRGIGRALAAAIAGRGGEVALVARPSDDLEEAAAAAGGRAYPTDLTDPAAVAALPDRVETHGPIDVLVNNAGVSHVGHVLDVPATALDEVIQVDLAVPIQLVRAFVPRMLDRGRGHVVAISSLAGVMSPPGLAAYSAAKAGLTAFTAGLRQDLRDLPIGVTTVELGSVDTAMDAASRAYGPLAEAAARSRGRDIVPMERVVAAILDAIERGDPSVRLPRTMAPLPWLAEIPRALTRVLFRRTRTRP